MSIIDFESNGFCPICGPNFVGACPHGGAQEKPDLQKSLADLKGRLNEAQDKMYLDMANSFNGMRVFEAEYLADDEVAVICGKDAYKRLKEKTESS